MFLVFCCILLQTPTQTPVATWSDLLDARIHRHAATIPPAQYNLKTQSQLVIQEYLLTLGQNGHPDGAKVIADYFSHPQLQSTALFAYGELAAPIEPLLNLKVADANRLFWWEALAKCAGENDRGRLLQLWQASSEQERGRSLRFLYRHAHEALNTAVLNALLRRPRGDNGDYFFYMYRNDIAVSRELFATQAANPDNGTQARIYLLRLVVSDADEGIVKTLTAFTKARDWRIRVNAINALGAVPAAHGEQPSPFLLAALPLLEDANPNVVTATLTQLVQRNEADIDRWLEPRLAGFSNAQKLALLENMEGERKQRFLHLIQNWRNTGRSWFLRQWITHEGPNQLDELTQWTPAKHLGLATLSFQVLTQTTNPEYRRWLNAALASNDPYLTATAVGPIAGNESLRASYIARINTLLTQTFPEPDFHYAVIDALEGLYPDPRERARMLQQLQGHPDYLVRLKAFNTADNVTFAQRRNLFNRPWRHSLPGPLKQQAALFAQGAAEPTWVITTNRGQIRIQLRSRYAPITCANIVYLSSKNYFDNMPIHRVVPNFVVQAGDSRGDGSGGPGHTIPCEINTLRYQRGTVGMALAGKDTGGSQFFICHSAQPHLDGNYTVFGQVLEGMALVDQLEEGDVIINTRVTF